MNRRVLTVLSVSIIISAAIIGWFVFHGKPETNPSNQTSDETSQQTDNDKPCDSPPEDGDQPQEGTIKPSNGAVPPSENNPPPPQPSPEQPVPPESLPTPAEICRGNTALHQVILTFDAGAGNQSFEEILAALARHQVTATFFITGAWAESNPDLLKKISSDGHDIFNHTYSHPNLTTIGGDAIITELKKTDTIIEQITSKTSKPYFRPPFGARNQTVLDIAWSQGYRSVYWSADTLDWQESATETSVRGKVLDNLAPGTIYLMHVGSKVTGLALDGIITEVKLRGYTIKPLSQGL